MGSNKGLWINQDTHFSMAISTVPWSSTVHGDGSVRPCTAN